MFSARGRAGRPVFDDRVASHALALAGELSETVRRERATARRLAEYLGSRMPAEAHAGTMVAGRRPSTGVDLRCLACEVTVHASVADVDGTVEQAQTFFSEHDRCRCGIDLTDPVTSRRWTAPPEQ